eukprot:5894298-Amphidinium_carterae.1
MAVQDGLDSEKRISTPYRQHKQDWTTLEVHQVVKLWAPKLCAEPVRTIRMTFHLDVDLQHMNH